MAGYFTYEKTDSHRYYPESNIQSTMKKRGTLLVLIAELALIVALHALKSADARQPDQLVNARAGGMLQQKNPNMVTAATMRQ